MVFDAMEKKKTMMMQEHILLQEQRHYIDQDTHTKRRYPWIPTSQAKKQQPSDRFFFKTKKDQLACFDTERVKANALLVFLLDLIFARRHIGNSWKRKVLTT